MIDKIDQNLNSIEKEIKFDKVMIAVGFLIMVASGVVLFVCVDAHPIIGLMCGLIFILGLLLAYAMIKEYLNDKSRLN